MRKVSRALLLASLAASLSWGAFAAEIVGKLDPEPVPAHDGYVALLKAAKGDETPLLPASPLPATVVFRGKLGRPFPDVSVALAVSKQDPVYLYVDSNRNSKFEEAERLQLEPAEDRPEPEGVASIRLEKRCGPHNTIPVALRLLRPREDESGDKRVLVYSVRWTVRGHVPIDSRDVAVEYPYSCDAGTVDIANGLSGIDSDGNGRIDWHPNSPENAMANGDPVVFRVGKHYVSTAAAEMETGRVVLRTHSAGDYQRIELTPGSQVPDFSYTDFDGREHRLSDLGERYLLLDFWFASCGPCIAEITNLKAVRERFRGRRFEVLSLTSDDDEQVGNARQIVASKEVDWPQAAGPSVRELILRRFGIRSYPNYVLLDHDRRIVSTGREGESPLRGKALAETLQKILR